VKSGIEQQTTSKTASEPRVSIILATYNRAGLLPRAIDSVLRQTFSDWELLIIDDGSTDETKALVDTYSRDDRRIRYICQENSGLALARNTGISAASGDYITFLDSDDAYMEDHLWLRLDYLRVHPDIDFIHGGAEVIGPDTVPDVNNPCTLIPLSQCFIGGTYFIRADVLKDLGGFRKPDFGCDYELMMRAVNLKIERVDWPTYIYHRETADSMCSQKIGTKPV
jgi:glycosyltransferase involved in cell wall biosynthesis